ncbi:DUF6923 family protein [Aquimarina rhabdastrellae]
MRKILLFAGLLVALTTQAQSPAAFDCNEGSFYQVISGQLKAYDPITGMYSDPLHTHINAYNAGGYNSVDNYLYAVNKGDSHLLRIGTDFIQNLGQVTQNNGVNFGGGYCADVDLDGNLWAFQNGDRQTFHKVVNLQTYDEETQPIFEIVTADRAIPTTCADIALIDDAFYGGGRGNLYKWDISSGTPVVTVIENVPGLPNSTFGAAYTDTAKRLYLSDNKGKLYLIEGYDTATPQAVFLNNTEPTNSNDGFKCAIGMSPLDRDEDAVLDSMDMDADNDGITDIVECNGVNPYGDDDNDSIFNYLDNDVSGNGDSVVQDAFDSDRDKIPNFLDLDSDNDGIYDIKEAGQGHKDVNGDGRYNLNDVGYNDSDLDGIADDFDPDQGGTPLIPIDTDNDNRYDCLDIDSDNDGIIDLIEGQDSNSFLPLSGIDQDHDGLDDNFDPDYGGSAKGNTNTDGDAEEDYLDLDSDDDGIDDTIEAYDTDGDGIANTLATGQDNDGDGLDDGYDRQVTNFVSDNGGQSPEDFPLPPICERYNTLGSYTADGTPEYLDGRDTVTQETLDLINNALPEQYPVPEYNAHYITSGYDTDLMLSEPSDVWVTFVAEGAGYRNTLGYYTYDLTLPRTTIPQPEDITIIFPNVSAEGSGGSLVAGDKVNIGNFPANTGIGWVLLADAWDGSCIDHGNWQLHSNSNFNPEKVESLRNHNVLIADPENERIILGFEDIRRDYSYCDHDFNDALFYITTTSYENMMTSNLVDISTATDVSSGNDGGLESNGKLAELIAKRNFLRVKNNTARNTIKKQQMILPNQVAKSARNNNDLGYYFPNKGLNDDENSYVSTPTDLLDITNATDILAIDYYAPNDDRIAAGLVTTTSGTIYDHSKTICDRLNGSSLEDVRTMIVKDHSVIHSVIKRSNGDIEHAISFSIKLHGAATTDDEDFDANTLYSLWNIAQYPEGEYLNFQVWGASMAQLSHIVNHIIDKLEEEKPLHKYKMENKVPEVFVRQGTYRDGHLMLSLVNKNQSSSVIFEGNLRRTEQMSEMSYTETLPLTGEYHQTIEVHAGFIFDIGFSISGSTSPTHDSLYLADGPWGIDYQNNEATVDTFDIILNTNHDTEEGVYHIERDALVSGEITGTVNVFRNILAGDLTFGIEDYKGIQFNLINDKEVEVVLVKNNLENWDDRLRLTIPPNATETHYKIPLTAFKDGSGNHVPIQDIKNIVFSTHGNYNTSEAFMTSVSELALIDAQVLSVGEEQLTDIRKKVVNAPNPFNHSTMIYLPEATAQFDIKVYDILGRLIRQETLVTDSSQKAAQFDTNILKQGVYKYVIIANEGTKHTGTFLIK